MHKGSVDIALTTNYVKIIAAQSLMLTRFEVVLEESYCTEQKHLLNITQKYN